MMNLAYKFRIYPTKEQETLILKTFGCCRFIYNRMLNDKIQEYEKIGKMKRTTPAMYKGEFPWLKEVDSLALAVIRQIKCGLIPQIKNDFLRYAEAL